MSKNIKVLIVLLICAVILFTIPVFAYLFVIPYAISNNKVIDYVQNTVKNAIGAELVLEKPVLKTSLKLEIAFELDNLILKKDNETILSIKNLDSEISFKNILKKQIILKTLGADDIFADINKIQSLTTGEQKEQKPFEYKIRWFNSELYLKKCKLLYRPKDKVLITLLAKDLEITKTKNPKYVHFTIRTDIEYDNQKFRLLFKDFDTIYFKNQKINIDNFKFIVDKSMVKINGYIDRENNYNLDISSDKFDVTNVKHALDSDLIIPNGKEVLACFKDLSGGFKFNFNLTNSGINGKVNINKINAKLIPLANIPFTVTKGLIEIDKKNIYIKDVDGYYGTKRKNDIDVDGVVKDYTKTADTTLAVIGYASDELAKYVSKVAGCKFNLTGLSKFALKVTYDISGKVTVAGGAKVPKGIDLLIENSKISSNKFDRALGLKLIMQGEELEIEHINYYISEFIAEKGKPNTKPLVSVSSKVNIVTGWIKELAFKVPDPLPSEFFNVLINQRLFRNGTFSGNLKYDNYDTKNPYIVANMEMKDVRVVGQGLSIKNGKMYTDKNNIHLVADGTLRRSKYKFDGDIQNRILFPIIVKNVDITFDELDIDRVMQTFAPRPKLTEEQRKQFQQRMAEMKIARSDVSTKYFEVEEKSNQIQSTKEEDKPIEFMPDIIAIKSCNFHVNKGQYKLINFGNLHAILTLTEKGILEIKSNKFDFAEGISTLKVYCDMVKQNYSVRLGAKDVDADAIASSTLNLPKEISGKASALLEFYTDKNMKLNGKIQFAINNGSIAKLGLVQYILNMAAIFRNPVVMISPSTLLDIVNVPDGSFKKINGTLEIRDNNVKRMMIKSSSPQLSAFIVGSMNLETMDASLRIYTKFSNKRKGLVGALRSLSLSTLAQKVPLGAKENVSYYAAELSMLPELETGENDAQVFLTKFDGDIQTNNFISSLKKIK
ncbi:hypothetical protein IJ818_06550 [bacterium]|nr:hypothetical protein [bacterium]